MISFNNIFGLIIAVVNIILGYIAISNCNAGWLFAILIFLHLLHLVALGRTWGDMYHFLVKPLLISFIICLFMIIVLIFFNSFSLFLNKLILFTIKFISFGLLYLLILAPPILDPMLVLIFGKRIKSPNIIESLILYRNCLFEYYYSFSSGAMLSLRLSKGNIIKSIKLVFLLSLVFIENINKSSIQLLSAAILRDFCLADINYILSFPNKFLWGLFIGSILFSFSIFL